MGAAIGMVVMAEPVLGWMAATGYTDPVLKPLADELQTRLGKS